MDVPDLRDHSTHVLTMDFMCTIVDIMKMPVQFVIKAELIHIRDHNHAIGYTCYRKLLNSVIPDRLLIKAPFTAY